jgi:hypothetical protein
MAEDKQQPVKVDLDTLDSSLVEEKVELNPDANPMEAPPPVDDGVHRVKLVLDPASWTHSETKANKSGEKRSYLSCQFYGVVIAEGTKNNNKRLFGRVNTLVFDGKSEMAYILLQVYGGKDNAEARAKIAALDNYVKLAQAFKQALAGEPIVKVSTKWVARYNAGTKDEPDYKTALSGQANFPAVDPKDPSKGKRHIINVPKVGEVAAQAQIQDYFPDK